MSDALVQGLIPAGIGCLVALLMAIVALDTFQKSKSGPGRPEVADAPTDPQTARPVMHPSWFGASPPRDPVTEAVGLSLFSLVALFWSLSVAAVAFSHHGPGVADRAAQSYADALRERSRAGLQERRFHEFVKAFRGSRIAEHRVMKFVPLWETATCDPANRRCAPTPGDTPIGSWYGQLHWEERRPGTDFWFRAECGVTLTLRQDGDWRSTASRGCQASLRFERV